MAYTKLKADYGECTTRTFTAGSDRSAGDEIVINGQLGVVYEDVSSGNEGTAIVGAPPPGIDLSAGSVALNRGDEATWDVADGNINNDTTNNVTVGWVYQDAASGDSEVRVVLESALNLGVS